MKKLISVMDWHDLKTGHHYKKGDEYPFNGKASKTRIAELSGSSNKAGLPLIKEVETEEES